MKLEGRNKYLLRKAMDSWIRRYKIYKKKKDEELLQKNILVCCLFINNIE